MCLPKWKEPKIIVRCKFIITTIIIYSISQGLFSKISPGESTTILKFAYEFSSQKKKNFYKETKWPKLHVFYS